jgi:DNA replication ATP-dependent helicase Dna2
MIYQRRAISLVIFRVVSDPFTHQPDAVLTDTRSAHDKPSLLAITKTYDFEEDIWSPTYGIKGKLDATVEAVIQDPGLPPFFLYALQRSYTA